MVCGANSDLFGRRTFILAGNVLVVIGSIVGATSHTVGQSIVAHAFLGFGGGNCQLAAFALPELLPNKWRHWAVVIADAGIYFDVIVGPVAARIAYLHGSAVSYSHLWCPSTTVYADPPVVALGLLGHNSGPRCLFRCSCTFLLPTEAP